MKIVTFYNSKYSKLASKLKKSVYAHGYEYDALKVDIDKWKDCCIYKPHAILELLQRHRCDLIYTDADSVLCKKIPRVSYAHIAAVQMDNDYWYGSGGLEYQTGTLYIPYCSETLWFLDKWGKFARVVDGKSFNTLSKTETVDILPPTFCVIKELINGKSMLDDYDPVFLHMNASRTLNMRSNKYIEELL